MKRDFHMAAIAVLLTFALMVLHSVAQGTTLEMPSTAYVAIEKYTDNTPGINACNKPVMPNDIAVTRKLFKQGWTCNRWVYIDKVGYRRIRDKLNKRYKKDRVDLLIHTLDIEADIARAKRWGVRTIKITLLEENEKI
jgi:3D (Asp-Asp-Asp) domain-containing protein